MINSRPTPPDIQHNLDVLLANLIGENNRVAEMGREQILPDMLTPYQH